MLAGMATRWTGILFALGSTCFLVGPLPGFAELVGLRADGRVFFVGSVLFTAAALVQWRSTSWSRERTAWWSGAWQLAGTLFFNRTTYQALDHAVGSPHYDQVVWRPDALGSVCFLVSGALAWTAAGGTWRRRPPRTPQGRIAAVNMVGCVAFGVSALTAYVVPSSATEVDAALAASTTCVGALAFLVGALLLLRPQASCR
jgi:hypothetical protein